MKKEVELTVEVIHQTDAAVLIKDPDAGEVWLPKSQIDGGILSIDLGLQDISIPEWLAIDKELV